MKPVRVRQINDLAVRFTGRMEDNFLWGRSRHTWVELLADFEAEVMFDTGAELRIVCPKGMWSNGASVPRFLRNVVSPWSIPESAVIHDGIMGEAKLSRKLCDQIFVCAMRDINKRPKRKCLYAYAAVRVGGVNCYGVKKDGEAVSTWRKK